MRSVYLIHFHSNKLGTINRAPRLSLPKLHPASGAPICHELGHAPLTVTSLPIVETIAKMQVHVHSGG